VVNREEKREKEEERRKMLPPREVAIAGEKKKYETFPFSPYSSPARIGTEKKEKRGWDPSLTLPLKVEER